HLHSHECSPLPELPTSEGSFEGSRLLDPWLSSFLPCPCDRLTSGAPGTRGTELLLAFGDYRLDVRRRELRRGGIVVELEPKVFDLLTFLVQHRDRVVSKDDLIRSVWNGRIVSDSAVTTRINAARRAIGDDGTAQRLIRTFTRKGVRFIGEVTEIPD